MKIKILADKFYVVDHCAMNLDDFLVTGPFDTAVEAEDERRQINFADDCGVAVTVRTEDGRCSFENCRRLIAYPSGNSAEGEWYDIYSSCWYRKDMEIVTEWCLVNDEGVVEDGFFSLADAQAALAASDPDDLLEIDERDSFDEDGMSLEDDEFDV